VRATALLLGRWRKWTAVAWAGEIESQFACAGRASLIFDGALRTRELTGEFHMDGAGEASFDSELGPGVFHASGQAAVSFTPQRAGFWDLNGQGGLQADGNVGHRAKGLGMNGSTPFLEFTWIARSMEALWQADGQASVVWLVRPGARRQDCLTGDGALPGGVAVLKNYTR